MSAHATDAERGTVPPGVRGQMRPFRGAISPGIGFESGHVIWLFRFEATPTPVGPYTEIWIESPDGEVTLYADPDEAVEYVTAYHEFDRVEPADVDWRQFDHERIDVAMAGGDGATLTLRASLAATVRTRVMDVLGAVAPDALLRHPAGGTVSSALFNSLMQPGGTKLLGRTETGRRYRGDADRLLTVERATATLDGSDLGDIVRSPSSRAFGDVRTAVEPYVVFGRLHLEYPAPGQPASE